MCDCRVRFRVIVEGFRLRDDAHTEWGGAPPSTGAPHSRPSLRMPLPPSAASDAAPKCRCPSSAPPLGPQETLQEEKALEVLFTEIVNIQSELKEDPRFGMTPDAKPSFSSDESDGATPLLEPGKGSTGLWGVIMLWQQFVETRTMALVSKMQQEIQTTANDYFEKDPIEPDKVSAGGEARPIALGG